MLYEVTGNVFSFIINPEKEPHKPCVKENYHKDTTNTNGNKMAHLSDNIRQLSLQVQQEGFYYMNQ